MGKIAIAIHGGAGTILRALMTADMEREYRRGLEAALVAGWEVLEKGASALDAVESAVISLEDFPLFNAGRGAVFTHDGSIEFDAAIMDGSRLKAGAIAFVKNIKNPVCLARSVMEHSEHVMLAGDGAEQFAAEMNVARAPDEYFFTEERWKQLQEARAAGDIRLDHTATKPVGTVGAVACDIRGKLAAATSTGGMTNKKFGRIGDTPIIGSGTYADEVCAVSCTGHGEFFMLGVTAYDVAARMKYKGLDVEAAGRETIEHLGEIGGDGGLIAVDANGNMTLPFNSEGMYRASMNSGDEPRIEIFR